MSYCVNCGVELEKTEKRCPLCNTPVINPKTYGLEEDTAVYKSYEKVGGLHIDFRFIAVIISILLLIPIFITSICNIVSEGTLTWSLYVIGACVVAFVVMLLPAFFKKKNPYLFETLDIITVFLYLCMINALTGGKWVFDLALPICMLTLVSALIYTVAIRNKKISGLIKAAVFLVFAGLYSLGLEIILIDWSGRTFSLNWSHFVLIPCAVITLILIFIDTQKKLKEELRKKLFM